MALEILLKSDGIPSLLLPFSCNCNTYWYLHDHILQKTSRTFLTLPKSALSTTSTMYSVTKNSCYENLSNALHHGSPAVNDLLSKPTYTVKIFSATQIESIPQSSPGEIPTEVQRLYTWAAHAWHHGQTSNPISDESKDSIYRRDECKDGCVGNIYSWACRKGWKAGHVFVDVLCGSKCMTCPGSSGSNSPITIPKLQSKDGARSGYCSTCESGRWMARSTMYRVKGSDTSGSGRATVLERVKYGIGRPLVYGL
ncbi:hypothetical protein BPAE_0147g00010 [Botrytis paeoniae]|uniref:Uncharacterized protein n=1 Tax=Botrytis paeoniae TaxID=278948 RepID=A0A4Z1FI87_9HELO|nr:hypothetical protein BPAE_0147g00010 [Botrytis paeoniae]